jgi:hypothetical protein
MTGQLSAVDSMFTEPPSPDHIFMVISRITAQMSRKKATLISG